MEYLNLFSLAYLILTVSTPHANKNTFLLFLKIYFKRVFSSFGEVPNALSLIN